MKKQTFETLLNIEPAELEWLWEPFIPYGMTTLLDGDPGVSKSYFAMYLSAAVTVGDRIFNGPTVPRGRVLYFSAEDDPGYTIRPRIEAMGGDLRRVRIQLDYMPFDDKGMSAARYEVQAFKPDLIVVDPLYAFVGSRTDIYRPNEIRAVLAKLNDLASSCGAALLLIRHLTKGKHDKAIYQGAGSIDVIGVARSAILIDKHPEDDELKVVSHLKHNLAPRGHSFVYRLSQRSGLSVPVVEFVEKSDLTVEDLLRAPQNHGAERERAWEFLRQQLKDGQKLSAEVQEAAIQEGISPRTLERAKRDHGVSSRKVGVKWFLSLPRD